MSNVFPKATLSVAEFCRAAGVGRSLFYKQVQAERIRVVKAGRRTLIPVTELAAWLERLTAEA